MSVRRVVTGIEPTGESVIRSDGPAPNVKVRKAQGGVVSTLLWVTDSSPADIADPGDKSIREIGVAPPANGTVFRMVDYPPLADDAAIDHGEALKELGLEAPGEGVPRHPLMHRTRSVDYGIVLKGEIHMLLEDREVHLREGDVVIQQGTPHAWVNRGPGVCRMAFVLVDAAKPPGWTDEH